MTQREPLIGAHFALDVDGVVSAFFKEASGFNNASEVITHQAVYAAGKSVIQKIPGDSTHDDITLSRGITDDKALWDWRQKIIDGACIFVGAVIVLSIVFGGAYWLLSFHDPHERNVLALLI